MLMQKRESKSYVFRYFGFMFFLQVLKEGPMDGWMDHKHLLRVYALQNKIAALQAPGTKKFNQDGKAEKVVIIYINKVFRRYNVCAK